MKNAIQSHRISSSEAKFFKGQHDILTFEEFEAGMNIVICKDCRTPHLESTWCDHPQGAQCYNCGCKETREFEINVFSHTKVHIKSKTIRISKSTKSFTKKLANAFTALKELDLLDRLLDLSQSVAVLKAIAIIFFIIAGSTTAILYSQSKMPMDEINQKIEITIDHFKDINSSFINDSESFNDRLDKFNYELLNNSKQTITYTKASFDYSKRKTDSVNYQVKIMIKSFLKWIEDL